MKRNAMCGPSLGVVKEGSASRRSVLWPHSSMTQIFRGVLKLKIGSALGHPALVLPGPSSESRSLIRERELLSEVANRSPTDAHQTRAIGLGIPPATGGLHAS